MVPYDPHGVWERVQQPPAADPQAMGSLLQNLWLDARIFQQLARKLPQAQALSAQARKHLACLKGMHILISGSPPVIPPLPVPGDPPELLLRQCYGRNLRLQAEYETRRGDPAYGHIFRRLAAQASEQSQRILELLGSLGK